MTTRQRYCEHKSYGVGYAILTKYRKDSLDDLWMCTFDSLQGKVWYCTKHFSFKEQIRFINDAEAKRLKKQPRTKTVQKKEKNLSDLLDSLRQTR